MTTPSMPTPGPALSNRPLFEVLDRLDNRIYRSSNIGRALGLAMRLGAPQPQIIWSAIMPLDDLLPPVLNDAVDAGRITHADAFEIENADVVLNDGAGGYCLAKISLTLYDRHIICIRRQADLLTQATGAPALPFVVAPEIPDTIRATAAAHQVAVCILPDKYARYGAAG